MDNFTHPYLALWTTRLLPGDILFRITLDANEDGNGGLAAFDIGLEVKQTFLFGHP